MAINLTNNIRMLTSYIGRILRDHNERLKRLELRAAEHYPTVIQEGYYTGYDGSIDTFRVGDGPYSGPITFKREDGTRALVITFQYSEPETFLNNGSMMTKEFKSNLTGFTKTYYNITGMTVVKTERYSVIPGDSRGETLHTVTINP